MPKVKRDYARKTIPPSYKRARETHGPRRQFTGTFWYVVLCVLVVFMGVGLYEILFTDLVAIRFIQIQGTVTPEGETVIRGVMDEVRGKNLVLERFSHEREAIAKRLFVRSVEIRRQFPNTVRVQIEERLPAYALARGDASYTADREGFILSNSARTGLLAVEIPTSTPEVVGGMQYQTDVFQTMEKLSQVLRSLDTIQARSFTFLRPAFIDVKIVTDRPWYLLIDITRPPDSYVIPLKTFLAQKAAEEKKFQYIDLRIKDTIYWK